MRIHAQKSTSAKGSIDQEIVNSVSNDLVKMTDEAGAEVLYDDTVKEWSMLSQAAQHFLDGIKTVERIIPKKITDPTKTRSYYVTAVATQFKYIEEFDQAISKFRGLDPKKLLYVYESANGTLHTYELSIGQMGELLKWDSGVRIDASLKKLRKLSNSTQSVEQKLKQSMNQSDLAAQSAYSGTKNRLNEYYKKVKATQKQGGLLMWRKGDGWEIARITNLGIVKEAYTNALYTEHYNNLRQSSSKTPLMNVAPGKPLYYSHGLIDVFYHEYLSKVTNAQALVEEDLNINGFQYAVKSKRAEIPSASQYEDFANVILSQKTPMTKQDLETYLSSIKKSAQLAPLVSSTLEDGVDTLMQPLLTLFDS